MRFMARELCLGNVRTRGTNAPIRMFPTETEGELTISIIAYETDSVKDGVYYCYCAYVLRISRY